jgi:ferredoxin-NADP reductase
MRGLLTRLRATALGKLVPFDDAIDFHRLVGHALFAVALAHSVAFGAAYVVGHAGTPLARLAETERGLTGLVLLAVFAVMWVFALGFIRRTNRFELFYFTHLLYVAWLGLAVAHAPSFLFWAGVPVLGFVVEQVIRLFRRAPAGTILSSRALRSGVTRLEIARPLGFTFSPGDYAFLRIPAVAKREWHPFTISSSPERSELTFHIRSLGNWTAALRRRVEATEDEQGLTAHVDGPYGSPSAHIFGSRFAVLIGAGIGVTPFASVLETIVLRGNQESPGAKLEKAYFFWLNKDQYSFEWFAELLSELEKIDKKGLLDIHLCMTAGRTGVTAMGLEIARQVMKAAGRSDLITGLRTHTHMGSPDWEMMLGMIARQHQPAKVDVYFCGPPGLAARIRPIAARHEMAFHEERF